VIGAGTYANNQTCAVSCTATANISFVPQRRMKSQR
jgi:Asparaginase